MSEVISRKIESARKINSPLPRLNEVLSAMSRAIEKKARNYLGSVCETLILDVETKSFGEVLDAISMPAMIGIAEVDGVDRAALLNFDLDLVYHVVDLRMGGSPSELPEFGARRPTAIDNVMCLPMVEIALDSFAAGLASAYGVNDRIPMRCDGFEHLPMLANIVSERADVLVVQVSLDIGEAARSGNFELVLPFATLDRIKTKLKKSESFGASDAEDAWATHMIKVVVDTEVELTPILQQMTANVSDLSALKVGQVLPLNDGAEQSVEIHMDIPGAEEVLATARLGSFKTQKALKLDSEPDVEFLAPLRRIVSQQPAS